MPTTNADPLKLIDDLFQWIAERNLATAPGRHVSTDVIQLSSVLKTSDGSNVTWAAAQLEAEGFIDYSPGTHGSMKLRVTQDGWKEYQRRQRAGEPNRGFMALKFNEPDLQPLIEAACRPACDEAGFSLVTALDVARAGLIDDIIRVELRRARFVLAELTHGNRGSYWEAGFAEALGKPVIYLCRKTEWDSEKTHFDTEHMHTIVWSSDDIDDARRRLAASLVNTFASSLMPA